MSSSDGGAAAHGSCVTACPPVSARVSRVPQIEAGDLTVDGIDYTRIVETVGLALEAFAVLVVVTGAVAATGAFVVRVRRETPVGEAIRGFRQGVGRGILLGLEFLIAADIIRTVVIDPTFERLGILAALVLIRTFLSFTLEVEIEGRLPWHGAGRETERDD